MTRQSLSTAPRYHLNLQNNLRTMSVHFVQGLGRRFIPYNLLRASVIGIPNKVFGKRTNYQLLNTLVLCE